MRGKGLFNLTVRAVLGITPAYAGKSKSNKVYTMYIQDHPRVCGEKSTALRSALKALGSPPRMRGKACVFQFFVSVFGITPAYAGKRVEYLPFSSFFSIFHASRAISSFNLIYKAYVVLQSSMAR